MNPTRLPVLSLAFLVAASFVVGAVDKEKLKAELIKTDTDFSRLALEKPTHEAFLAYMAERSTNLNTGTHTREQYRAATAAGSKGGRLVWTPRYADVADSGELGYTWGTWDFTATGPDGQERKSQGCYITVWRKQADGSWKFVLDGGPALSVEAVAKLLENLKRPAG
ncbi:MAG: hypothetical protein A3G75_08570 [Verrucomicrobia bacterium RIFCSPLOWO2_12_FULL_64_8]|nr:MAG: hypothetical protein A3G75_08570 [Verrucomicrobia bacterium RIFCSPLOWO2_12_FULL_64_8]